MSRLIFSSINKKALIFIAIAFAVWRLFLFFPIFAAEEKIDYRKGYEYTGLAKSSEKQTFNILSKLSLAPFANFDGLHYLFIAGNGYTNNFGFFPLYPATIKATGIVLGAHTPFDLSYFLSALLISNFAFFLSLIVFYKLLRLDYSDKQSRQTLLGLLIFPTSFFFASLYTESIFLLFLFLSFYFARKKRWLLSGISAFFLTLTRLVGIVIFPVLLFEYIKSGKPNIKSFIKSGLWISPLGLAGYSIYNYILSRDFLYFIHAQGNFANNRSVDQIVLFPQTIYRYFKILISNSSAQFEWWVALLEISSFIFALTALYIAWKKKVRQSYLLFSILAILIPASTGTFSAIPRYILVAFPIFIVLGLITNKGVKLFIFSIFIFLLFILMFFFSKGYFIA